MKKKLVVGLTASISVVLIEGQLKYFSDRGYIVYLMSPKSDLTINFCKKENAILLPVKIKREISLFSDLFSFFQILYILLRLRPDIVNFGTPKIGLLGMIAAKCCFVPKRIYTCRGFRYEHEHGFIKKILMLAEKISAICAHQVVCISPSLRSLGVNNKLFDVSKSILISKGSSNGIDLKYFNKESISAEEIAITKNQFGLENTFVYGFVGRIIDRKGIMELYDSFVSLYDQDNNIRLLLVGPFESEQLSDKSIIQKCNSHPAIIVCGYQKNIPLFMSMMDVFVLPAWWEGFGNVLIQAAAMGVPVISSLATGTCDAVSDGYNGILVEPRNRDLLFEAMKVLKDNPSIREAYGQNGILWAENFPNEKIWEGLNNLYVG